MNYSIKLNAVNNPDKNVKAFATVTFGDCFKITNIAVVKSQEAEPFVSMPSFKSKERTEHNQPVYKDVCNPITSEFRKELYDDILSLYSEMEQSGKTEVSRDAENAQEPEFRVAVTLVVSNVSIIQGKEKEFVAMPSYMVKQNGGKSQYQDVCFPVTKEFREKLYDALMDCYQQERDKAMNQGMEQATSQSMERAESRQPDRNLPFR
ncbi:MAG: putative septation protein SpoVG [Firmicutes bacterium ADurb.Bin419]|nr:MAG: putative septation protein SpoVG [Firmicutes bacterium ADurb.Bin419]